MLVKNSTNFEVQRLLMSQISSNLIYILKQIF